MDIVNRIDQFLNEMATLCSKKDGLGIKIIVHSDDHEPAHAHVTDYDNREIGQFLITDQGPKTIDDIKVFKGTLDKSVKEAIFKWSKGKTRKKKVNNWDNMVVQWDTFQADKF